MRWDDDEYQFLASDELPVMLQSPKNGRYGFVLYDACWNILKKAFEPCEIPVARLVEVCRSLPFPLGEIALSWGHGYGGVSKLELQTRFPWEEVYRKFSHGTEWLEYAEENPCEVLDIPVILKLRLGCPPVWVPGKQALDCFSWLPWEILEAIAVELPTPTALNLRLVSVSFLPLLSSGMFWAPRFEARRERGFLFEKWNNRDITDWLSLDRLTSDAVCSNDLRNRRRMWSLIWPLVDLTKLNLAAHTEFCHSLEKLPLREWTRVAGKRISGDLDRN